MLKLSIDIIKGGIFGKASRDTEPAESFAERPAEGRVSRLAESTASAEGSASPSGRSANRAPGNLPIDCDWSEGRTLRSICSAILDAAGFPESEWEALGGVRLVGLVEEGRLSGSTVARLVDLAFKRRTIADPALVPFGLDLASLLSSVRASDLYMDAIAEHGHLDKVDIATLFLGDDFHLADPEAASIACKEFLSGSFEKQLAIEVRGNGNDGVYLWIKYLTVAAQFCQDVPEALVEYADGDLSRRCSITSCLSNCIKKFRKWGWASDGEKARFAKFAESILLLLVDSDADDYVALWELGALYEAQNRLDEANGCYYEASSILRLIDDGDPEAYCKVRMSSIKCQERECKAAVRSGDHDSARAIAKGVYKQYSSLIAYADHHGIHSDGFKQGYARFQKDRRNFDGAYETIKSIEDGYRRNLELGMLHSSDNLERSRAGARFLDYAKAVDCYALAWRALEESNRLDDAYAQMSVLYPLAHALFRGGRSQESYEVCTFAESVKHEPKIVLLKQRLEDKGVSPLCGYQGEAIPALLAS